MSPDPAQIARQLRRLYPRGARRTAAAPTAPDAPTDGPPLRPLESYRDDPVGFIDEVLGVTLTPDQQAIAKKLPGRTKVNAGHNVGKTLLAACLCLWWFYTRPKSVVITTAPTERDVIDLLWTEIRIRHAGARRPLPDFFAGPKSAEMFDNEEHWAKGYTARRGESFQGRHRESMLFIFDEAEGVDPIYWEVTGTSYKHGWDHGWLAIGNPVTTSSQSYVEDRARTPDGKPKWDLTTLSALNHPNVLAELRGEPPPIPNAVSLSQVDQWVQDWCEPVAPDERLPDDLEWRPGSGNWVRPGPQMKARGMGIRPTDGVNTVWGARAWREACYARWTPTQCWTHNWGITIGVDVASYGDDFTVLHVRTGPLSVHHESHNGWGPQRIADKIQELSVQWAAWYNAQATADGFGRPPLRGSEVRVVIELDGPGAAVLDLCNGRGAWGGIKVAEASQKYDGLGIPMYANIRSEMWFAGRDKALAGNMDLHLLPQNVLARLEDQLLTPAYKLLPAGTMQVEPKQDIKTRLKRSPDDGDGLLVAYLDVPTYSPTVLFKNGG